MDTNIFLIFFWLMTVYRSACSISRSKPKRDGLSESEPHPYTISFFTFPKGAASVLFKPKTASGRQTQGSIVNQTEDQASQGLGSKGNGSLASVTVKLRDSAKRSQNESRTSGGHMRHVEQKDKHHHSFVKIYEQPNAVDKVGKSPDVGPQKGRQKVEPWKLGASHNEIEFKKHQQSNDESYQEGSVNHPSHTMYPKCYHCPSNSTYEECSSKSTLAKCDQGLKNICFTKSFHSNTRGIIYEMGCANHLTCTKAKASPCKGTTKKCFVCCQYDGCNAVPHYYPQWTSKTSNDSDTMFSFNDNRAEMCFISKWNVVLLIFTQVMIWILI